jgi:hypothetical protein
MSDANPFMGKTKTDGEPSDNQFLGQTSVGGEPEPVQQESGDTANPFIGRLTQDADDPSRGVGLSPAERVTRSHEALPNAYKAQAEVLATVASGFGASVVGGWGGIGAIVSNRLFGTDFNPTDVVRGIQKSLTYTPKADESKEALDIIYYPLEKWSEKAAKPAGELAQDLGAPPSVAAGIETAVEFAPWIIAPKLLKRAKALKSPLLQQEMGMKLQDGKWVYDSIAQKAGELKAIVAPIGTGSPKAQAVVKNYVNNLREIDVMRNHAFAEMTKRFSRKENRAMFEAVAADELAMLNGKPPTAVDALPLNQKNAVRAIQASHEAAASEAMQFGVISVSKEGYVPRRIVREMGMGTAEAVYGTKAVKTAVKSAKKRKYKTVAETEAAAIELLGENVKVSRDIRQYTLLDAELRRAVEGKKLISEIREFGTKIEQETVRYWDGKDTPGYFRIDSPAFTDFRPEIKARPPGEVGAKGGKTKIRRDQEGEIVWERKPLEISKDFEGPLRAALENKPNKVYQGIMKLKQAQMLAIMVSPMMHGMVIWGKALPFQIGRTLTFKNYREGHRIENITKGDRNGLAKQRNNDAWVRDKSNGEFSTTKELLSQMIKDGHVPMGNMGWYQRMSDIMSAPKIEAGRSVVSRVAGVAAKLFGETAQIKTMRAVDMAGQFWHDTLLWDQVRASGYGMYFDLRTKMIKQGVHPDVAGKVSAHLANRFTGSIPFEDLSAGTRATMNTMLFSKSFTGTNIGLYTDALRGLPRAVQNQLIDAGHTVQGMAKGNNTLRRAAGAALVKDILGMYLLNSLTQNAVKVWQETVDLEWGNLFNDKKFADIDADQFKPAIDGIIREYENGVERYTDPATSLLDIDELFVGGTNDPGKRQRVLLGTKPDGTAEYIRLPVGKVGEDLEKSMRDPVELAWNKLSPVVGFTTGVLLNDKSKQRGYGMEVYDEDGSTVSAAGDIIKYFFETSIAHDYAKVIVDAALGDTKAEDAWKAAMMTAGFSFSSGSPGGPERGAVFKEEERHMRSIRRHSKEAKELLQAGKHEEAVDVLINKADMSGSEVLHWITRRSAPVLSEQQIQSFMMTADELEKKRLMHQLELSEERR